MFPIVSLNNPEKVVQELYRIITITKWVWLELEKKQITRLEISRT